MSEWFGLFINGRLEHVTKCRSLHPPTIQDFGVCYCSWLEYEVVAVEIFPERI